jgi:hypothetical protein
MAQKKYTNWNQTTHAKRKPRKRWLPHEVKERKHRGHPKTAVKCVIGPHRYEKRCQLCDEHLQWLTVREYRAIKENT